eukprot:2245096-Rhodomonas_salina.2
MLAAAREDCIGWRRARVDSQHQTARDGQTHVHGVDLCSQDVSRAHLHAELLPLCDPGRVADRVSSNKSARALCCRKRIQDQALHRSEGA